MGAPVSEKAYWINSWTPVNPPGNIASSHSPAEASHFCHDEVDHDGLEIEVESSQASSLRSAILASAERMKWPPGRRKRKKSPVESQTRPRKKVCAGATKANVPRRITGTTELESYALKPRSPVFTNPDEVVPLSAPVLLPWDSNEQNANISKKRIASKVLPRPKTRSSMLVTDERDEQKKIEPIDNQTPPLNTADGNFDDLFRDSPEDVEDLLEAEKQLTATLSQPANPYSQKTSQKSPGMAAFPRGAGLEPKMQINGESLRMKPFMPETLQPPPSHARPTGTLTHVDHSPLKQTPTCFRIAEALRLLNSANPSHTLIFELFAVLRPTWTMMADETVNKAIEISDLFFPDLPPVLRLNIDSSQINSWRECGSPTTSQPRRNLQNTNGQAAKAIIRATIKAWPQTTPPSPLTPRSMGNAVRAKFEISVIHLRPTTWDEIRATRTLIETSVTSTTASSYHTRK